MKQLTRLLFLAFAFVIAQAISQVTESTRRTDNQNAQLQSSQPFDLVDEVIFLMRGGLKAMKENQLNEYLAANKKKIQAIVSKQPEDIRKFLKIALSMAMINQAFVCEFLTDLFAAADKGDSKEFLDKYMDTLKIIYASKCARACVCEECVCVCVCVCTCVCVRVCCVRVCTCV